MRRIAIEEHFHTEYYINYLLSRKGYPRLESIINDKGQKNWRMWQSPDVCVPWLPAPLINKLCDIEEFRLKEMDEVGIDVQVLSLNENFDQLDATEGTALTRKINDILADIIEKHPDRFAGLAALALRSPDAAADELERAVKQLGLKGALILPHVGGEFIDAKPYWPIFERAAKLEVPIYIHPAFPSTDRRKQYTGYPEIAGPLWGFAAEASLAAVRLICSGIFDEYPDLKIILGHLGEALPFWMWRLDNRMEIERTVGTPFARKLKKLPSLCIKDNIFVTTSGMLWGPALTCTQMALGTEKILFSVDYPFEPNQEAINFMESALKNQDDKEKVFHLNTEKLLKL